MTPPAPSTADILARFRQQRILIVGDVMLDEYVRGTVRRISAEAPVPIVELEERSSHVPGGAANAAANVSGLGARVDLLGVIGADEAGKRLQHALEQIGVVTDWLLVADDRPTTVKTRIVAHGQQIVRVDHEYCEAIPAALEERLARLIDERLADANACILSDYAKGIVSPQIARRFLDAAQALGKPVIIDPKGCDYARYRGATVVKPNLQEAGHFLGRQVNTVADVVEAGEQMLAFLGCAGVLITRGAAGMSLFQRDGETLHIPAQCHEVYDVTGAGDTVVSTLTVALAAGAGLAEAARLASVAAGIIVGRLGTTAITLDELSDRA